LWHLTRNDPLDIRHSCIFDASVCLPPGHGSPLHRKPGLGPRPVLPLPIVVAAGHFHHDATAQQLQVRRSAQVSQRETKVCHWVGTLSPSVQCHVHYPSSCKCIQAASALSSLTLTRLPFCAATSLQRHSYPVPDVHSSPHLASGELFSLGPQSVKLGGTAGAGEMMGLLPGPCFGVELHGTLLQLSTVVSLMLDTNRPPGSTLPLQAMQPEQAAQLLTKFTLWKYY
jgi:hypothetical protein